MAKILNAVLYETCCNSFTETLTEEELISAFPNGIFNMTPGVPCVAIISDNGHGGARTINFCPFCGERIEILTTSTT